MCPPSSGAIPKPMARKQNQAEQEALILKLANRQQALPPSPDIAPQPERVLTVEDCAAMYSRMAREHENDAPMIAMNALAGLIDLMGYAKKSKTQTGHTTIVQVINERQNAVGRVGAGQS